MHVVGEGLFFAKLDLYMDLHGFEIGYFGIFSQNECGTLFAVYPPEEQAVKNGNLTRY